MKSVGTGAVLGFVLSLALGGVALAWTNGDLNGSDSCCDWPGADDNGTDGTGSYCYYNVYHDAILKEYNEPLSDKVRDKYIRFSSTTEQLLNDQADNKVLTFEQNISDQYNYNWNTSYVTSLPHTGPPAGETFYEEWLQGYTETDMELRDTSVLDANVDYFHELHYDSERVPPAGQPTFNSECEWENMGGGGLNWDVTGTFRKDVLMQ